MESNVTPENKNQTEYQPGHCNPMKPPSIGTLTLVAGNGTNVGTVMTLWCPLLHRASSGGLIKCEQDSTGTHWTGGIPECKRIEHQDFHLAVLLSIISTGIIIIMSVYFITSCLLNCVKKEEARQLDRALERENARLWKQLNEEEQRDSFYNHNGRLINNNNNNNSNQEQHSRCHQKNSSDPQPSTTHSQPWGKCPTHYTTITTKPNHCKSNRHKDFC